MQKTKLFVTASAVCFALAGAALSERQSESSAAIIYAAGYLNDACLRATDVYPENCSILGGGAQCLVNVTDSWGTSTWVAGYGSPIIGNLCLLPLKRI